MTTTIGGLHPSRHTRRALRCQHRAQLGLTLIELLVAIAVIAVGVVGIAYGFAAAVRGSAVTQQQATLDAAAREAATDVQTGLPYTTCAVQSTYDLGTPPSGLGWSIISVTLSDLGSERAGECR